MADDAKTADKQQKPAEPTAEQLKQQLEAAKAEIAELQSVEEQLATAQDKLAAIAEQQSAVGATASTDATGAAKFTSTVCRKDHQTAKQAELKKTSEYKPTPVRLHSFHVQDLAKANPAVTVDNCCDESEAKRVYYAMQGLNPSQVKVRVRKSA